LNAFSFWLFLFGATIAIAGFITPVLVPPTSAWTAYSPLTDAIHSPVRVGTCGSWASQRWSRHHLGGVNMITTVVCIVRPA